MRITRVYTRTGDDGTTSLARGKRVSKDSPVIGSLGSLDETNSAIGVVLAKGVVHEIDGVLRETQHVLFNIGGELAVTDRDLNLISEKDLQALEENIDRLNSVLPPLKEFVLPGGSPASARLQLARAVCRRAERDLVALSRNEPVNPLFLAYLNRLSDFLSVAARYQNAKDGGDEPMWEK